MRCIITRLLIGLSAVTRPLGRDERGGIATLMGAAIIPLVAFGGLAVDTARGYMVKTRLNYALDAAALAGGRAMHDAALRDAEIERFFKANFPDGYLGVTLDGPHAVIDNVKHTITLNAAADMDTSLIRVLGVYSVTVGASTEVTLSSRNLEVSVVLDLTGSMAGQRIIDLREAAKDLVDIVVQDQQEPHYSKLALVPYSMAVNVGGYAPQARGAVLGPAVNITGASRTNPVVINATGHGFTNGQNVFITGVNGMTQLNNNEYTVASATANTFALNGVDGSSYSNYTSGGIVGRVCTSPGCEFYRFRRASDNNWRTNRISTCVTERTGPNAYSDVSPTVAFVSPSYPNIPNSSPLPPTSQYNPCLPNAIVPLTSNKTLLHNEIDAFEIAGSTSGHIGVAWGWYMLSPNFAYLWPTDSQPAAYDAEDLLKAAIIMTDGEFNSVFFNGVVAQNSGTGSGSAAYHINQNSLNGSSFNQAQQLCSAMKAAGIVVYTVGFHVGTMQAAVDFLQDCASEPSNAYLSASGEELKTAFREIAMKISTLRLSK